MLRSGIFLTYIYLALKLLAFVLICYALLISERGSFLTSEREVSQKVICNNTCTSKIQFKYIINMVILIPILLMWNNQASFLFLFFTVMLCIPISKGQ